MTELVPIRGSGYARVGLGLGVRVRVSRVRGRGRGVLQGRGRAVYMRIGVVVIQSMYRAMGTGVPLIFISPWPLALQ